MGKSIVWRSKQAKFEFFIGSADQVSLEIMPEVDENPFEPVVITLGFDDIQGVEQILSDLRYDLERNQRTEKEVSDGN